MKIEDYFCIGFSLKTKGFRGGIQVFFQCDPHELDLKVLFVEIEGQLVPYFVTSYQIQSNQVGIFLFDDVNTTDQAQKILRKKLYLPEIQRRTQKEKQSLMTDLKGYMVCAEPHGTLGQIIEIHRYPKQDVASFLYKNKEIMLPLNDHLIQKIDTANRLLHVFLPDGLLELYLGEPS